MSVNQIQVIFIPKHRNTTSEYDIYGSDNSTAELDLYDSELMANDFVPVEDSMQKGSYI